MHFSSVSLLLSIMVVHGQRLDNPSTGQDFGINRPSVTSSGEACTTPDGVRGACERLSDCQAFATQFKRGPDPTTIDHLRKSVCTYEGGAPVVCCPPVTPGLSEKSVTTTTTEDPSISGPIRPPGRQPSFTPTTQPLDDRRPGGAFLGGRPGRPIPGRRPERPTPGRRPELLVPSRQPELSSPPRQPEFFSPPRQPELSSPPRQPEFFSPPRQPEFFSPPRQPELISPTQPELIFPSRQPELLVPSRQPELLVPSRQTELSLFERRTELPFLSRRIIRPTSSSFNFPRSSCGRNLRTSRNFNAEEDIAKCKLADKGSWPWLAALGYIDTRGNLQFLCEGALITDRHILTAASCVHNKPNLISVRLGEHDFQSSSDTSHEDYYIAERKVHGNYGPNFKNDIAILTLGSAVQYREHISPVCLAEQNYFNQRTLSSIRTFVAGWSSLGNSNSSSSVLTEVMIPFSLHEASRLVVVDANKLCSNTGGNSACEGIAGGPLVAYNPSLQHYSVLGIVSHGFRCTNIEFPGIYTRVTEYVEWIKDQID